MAINPRYVAAAPSLQMVFRDKLTGLPLRSGKVKGFQDNSRATPKTFYKLSGTPGNYSFTAIGSTVILTGIGTFSDNDGNDIIPYYLPYESDSSDIVELYYIQVLDEDDFEQFTREAWPPGVGEGEDESTTMVNYVPNGQFLMHHDLPETTDYEAGEIREAITDIAQGGWTFERPEGATSSDFVTFVRFGSFTTNPTASPRYALRVVTESVGSGGDYKDVRIKFLDVNKFASATQKYTLSVTAKTNSGSSATLLFYYIKNYGTGSGVSPQEEKEIASATLSSTYQIFNNSFVFGANTSKTIGANNDDFIQIAIRYPVDEVSDISIDNVVLTIGEANITSFPITTDAEFLKSLPGLLPVPNYNNANLYLPLELGPQGYVYDDSVISNVRISTKNDIDPKRELNADGTQYETAGYSAYGVPYSRLQAKWWIDASAVPKWGTGPQYVTVWRGTTGVFAIHTNTAGSVTATADGTPATGFTFQTIATGNAAYYTQSAWLGTTEILLQNLERGAVTAATANTSGFAIAQMRVGSTLLQEITRIGCVAASSLANPGGAGKYFKFFSYHSGAPVEFFVWYQITNETVPPGGGTGIKINLAAGDTAANVAQKTSNVLNGWQVSLVTATAASAITAGSYFIFNSSTTGYYAWFTKDGAGTDPAPSGRTGIKVELVAADTANIVADKIRYLVNQKYFAVPDFRGMYLQGLDPNQTIDKDFRWSLVDNINGMMVGTFQYDDNLSHYHTYDRATNQLPQSGDTVSCFSDHITDATSSSGSYNTRPRNAVVNFYIRY